MSNFSIILNYGIINIILDHLDYNDFENFLCILSDENKKTIRNNFIKYKASTNDLCLLINQMFYNELELKKRHSYMNFYAKIFEICTNDNNYDFKTKKVNSNLNKYQYKIIQAINYLIFKIKYDHNNVKVNNIINICKPLIRHYNILITNERYNLIFYKNNTKILFSKSLNSLGAYKIEVNDYLKMFKEIW